MVKIYKVTARYFENRNGHQVRVRKIPTKYFEVHALSELDAINTVKTSQFKDHEYKRMNEGYLFSAKQVKKST